MEYPKTMTMFVACIVTYFCIASFAQAADKVVVVPLGSNTAGAKIAHITFNAPNTGSSCVDCYGMEMPASGKVLAVQTWCPLGSGNDWWGDVKKNGVSVLTTRPQFLTASVGTGVVKTDGTEVFAQGDVLTFSTVEDTDTANPVYPSVTAIVQYD
ncbi:MAG: hypothetical protein ACYDBT_16335 [Desulfobulbaceae bacterium]